MASRRQFIVVQIAAFAVLSAAVATSASAAPTVVSVSHYVDRYAPNTVPGFVGVIGNTLSWGVNATTTGVCGGVSGTFSRGSSGPFPLNLNSDPIFSSNCLFTRNSAPIANDADFLAFAGSTPQWSYTLMDGTGSVSGLFLLIANPQLMPFATDIMVSDSSTTPLVTWDLPDLTGFELDRLRFRVITSTGVQIFQQDLATNATSFQMPDDFLQVGQSYYYRVILEDLETGRGLENRSSAFSRIAFRVPEPGTLALLGLGLAGLAATRRRKQ